MIVPSVVPFSCLQSFQHQGLFQGVSSLHQVAKLLEFQLQHQYFQWIFRTDFQSIFRIDWFDLLAVQGALKSLLQLHSSKASILQYSAFFETSLVVQMVKNLPTMQIPLEKEMATHSSTLAWKIPWTQSTGSQRVRHNWATSLQPSLWSNSLIHT